MEELFCPTCGKSLGKGPIEANGVECWSCMFETMDRLNRELLDALMMDTQDNEVIPF